MSEYGVIVWDSDSVIVPARAIMTLYAFNQMYNYVRLVQCASCECLDSTRCPIKRALMFDGVDESSCVAPSGFCAWGKPRENPCRNADENTADFADAPTLKAAGQPA